MRTFVATTMLVLVSGRPVGAVEPPIRVGVYVRAIVVIAPGDEPTMPDR